MDLRATFWALVREIVGQPLDAGASPEYLLLGRYRATVVSQNADRSLEVQAEDSRIGGMKNVPMRLPIPNCDVIVAPGAVVLLCFEGGDRGKAYCAPEWESGASLTQLSIGSAAEPVATKTDILNIIASLNAAVCGGSGGPLAFTVVPLPTGPTIGSKILKAAR